MAFTEKKTSISDIHGAQIKGLFRIWEESPDNDENVKLVLLFADNSIEAESEIGLFDALCEIRKVAEKEGFIIQCNGSAKNIFPSSMSRTMGVGDKAYRLTMGKQALNEDLVSIFDIDEAVEFVSLEEQKKFYNEWFESLQLE